MRLDPLLPSASDNCTVRRFSMAGFYKDSLDESLVYESPAAGNYVSTVTTVEE